MAYPSDELARRRRLAIPQLLERERERRERERLNGLERRLTPDAQRLVSFLSTPEERAFQALGVEAHSSALDRGLDAEAAEFELRQRHGFIAGEMLTMILMPPRPGLHRVSVRGAADAMTWYFGQRRLTGAWKGPRSLRAIMAAWSEMKPVAHFWCARVVLKCDVPGVEPVDLGAFLAAAEEIANRALGVLRHDDLWRVLGDEPLPAAPKLEWPTPREEVLARLVQSRTASITEPLTRP
jgi:hypothetical protein